MKYLNRPQCGVTTRITITDTRIEYKNNKNNNKIINIKNKNVYLDLKYLKNSKTKSKQLNYRLQTLPYRKLLSNLEYKATEKEISVIKVNPNSTSVTCPICGYKNKKNRLNSSSFKCINCGFEFDAQFVACLNLLSRTDDSRLAIRHGRLLIRKAGLVVPVYVAPDEVLIHEALREKPVLVVSKIISVV